jgi:hypothetical protein
VSSIKTSTVKIENPTNVIGYTERSCRYTINGVQCTGQRKKKKLPSCNFLVKPQLHGRDHVSYTSKQQRLKTKNVLSADICSHLHSALFVFKRQFVWAMQCFESTIFGRLNRVDEIVFKITFCFIVISQP